MSNTTTVQPAQEAIFPAPQIPQSNLDTLTRLSIAKRADESNDARWLAEVVREQHLEDGHDGTIRFCYSAACRAADQVLNDYVA